MRYDALGRTRVLPSVDTVDGGGDVALDFYVDDLVASMSQGGRTTAFGLDAAARRVTRTDTDAAVPGERRTTSLYSGDDDNPDVVQEPDNSFTRNITSFGGLAVVQTLAGTTGKQTTLQLANLHGDVAATVPADATSAGDVRVTETTEYGVPWVKPAAGSTQNRYGWLGTHQRDASTPGGLTLMGVRLYAPTLGRFLSVDPVEGGNPNSYVYPADPVNMYDLDGRFGWLKKAVKWVKKNKVDIALAALSFVPGAGLIAVGIRTVRIAKAVVAAQKLAAASKRHNALQQALVAQAKAAKKAGGLGRAAGDRLAERAKSSGFPNSHGPSTPTQGKMGPHTCIGPVRHIPCK